MNFNFNLGTRGSEKPPAGTSPTSVVTGDLSLSPAPEVTESQSPPDDNWEPVDLSSTEYASRRRELMKLISDLRSLGGETVLDLPSIVVIGGQSAGKSSLVEAVSGVSVPRDSGTCTRCPTECTMSSNATSWSCRIKLRFDYDTSGHSALKQREISFGPMITNKDDVDIWLRRAQAAILNPSIAPESFYKRSIQDLKDFTHMLKFSRNVISIFIEDPSATDLSFVDLPGLIQNEDLEVLDLVQQLTESYIRRSNTIILTTIPMSDDMQNQQSVRLARDADPDGERTIGILTKPDTLGAGAVNAKKFWLDVIEGRRHPLKHGYYCVRLPDDIQRAERLSKSASQRIATEYFDTTSPWSEVTNRRRFGIPALVSDISVLLVKHINKVIPQLREDVERLLSVCLKEISTLPKPLETDPQIEVLKRVNGFCDAFKAVVSGASADKSLAQRNRALYTKFAQDIRETSPDFRPFEVPTGYSPIYELKPEELGAEEVIVPGDCDSRSIAEPIGVPSPVPKKHFRKYKVQTTKARGCDPVTEELSPEEVIVPDDCVSWSIAEPIRVPNPVPKQHGRKDEVQTTKARGCDPESSATPIVVFPKPMVAKKNGVQTMGVMDVRRTILDSIAWELPGNIPFEAKVRLIKRSTTLWSEPAERCLTSIYDVLEDVIEKFVETHFGRFKILQELISDIIRPDIEEHKQTSRVAVKETLGLEATLSYTQNLKDFEKLREKWLAKYRYARRHPAKYKIASPDDTNAGNWRSPSQAKDRDLTEEDLPCPSHRDKFEDELIVMADVRAYFTIAYKRIIDHVPLKIEQSLYQALAERLSVGLLQHLMADTSSTGNFADRMRELVSEDPVTEAKRSQLEASRTRLREMRRKIVSFTT